MAVLADGVPLCRVFDCGWLIHLFTDGCGCTVKLVLCLLCVCLTTYLLLRNICFVQGLYSDRIQTIVRRRNHSNFDDIAETALEEESAIFSKNERYKNSNAESPKCSNCNKLGYVASRCYLKDRKDKRVN